MYAALFVSLLALAAPVHAEPSVQTVEDNAGHVLCDAQEPGMEVSSGIVERLDADGGWRSRRWCRDSSASTRSTERTSRCG